jgi:hypothetical protein
MKVKCKGEVVLVLKLVPLHEDVSYGEKKSLPLPGIEPRLPVMKMNRSGIVYRLQILPSCEVLIFTVYCC